MTTLIGRAPLSSRLVFSSLGVLLPVGAHLADMVAPTHIYNMRWPPHAKFHGAQTLAMSIVLGLLTIVFAWRRSSDIMGSAWAAFAFVITYPLTQAAAILYPGTAFFDPEFVRLEPLGVPLQLWLGGLQVALASLAVWACMRSRSAESPS